MIKVIRNSIARQNEVIGTVETPQQAKQVLNDAIKNRAPATSYLVRNMATNRIVTANVFLKQGFSR